VITSNVIAVFTRKGQMNPVGILRPQWTCKHYSINLPLGDALNADVSTEALYQTALSGVPASIPMSEVGGM
jgi:hypothetical protein